MCFGIEGAMTLSPSRIELGFNRYIPPATGINMELREPFWVWRKEAIKSSSVRVQVLNSSFSHSGIRSDDLVQVSRLLEKKREYAEKVINYLCIDPEQGTFKNMLIISNCSRGESAAEFIMERCIISSKTYIRLQELVKALQDSDNGVESAILAFKELHAWNPVESIVECFWKLYQEEEAVWMRWTAQERWKKRPRSETREEWALILEDAEFAYTYRDEVFRSMLNAFGPMEGGDLFKSTMILRREMILAMEAASGLEVGAGGPTKFELPRDQTNVHLFMKIVRERDDVFSTPDMEKIPFGAGWVTGHPVMASLVLHLQKTPPARYALSLGSAEF